MKLEKLHAYDKSQLRVKHVSPKHYIKGYKQQNEL